MPIEKRDSEAIRGRGIRKLSYRDKTTVVSLLRALRTLLYRCNSDANHVELVQTLQDKGTVPNETALVLVATHKLRGPQATCTFDHLVFKLRGPMISSGWIIHWTGSRNSEKCYTHHDSFIVKDTNQDQPNEKTHRVRSRKVPNAEFSCPFLMESGCITLPAH